MEENTIIEYAPNWGMTVLKWIGKALLISLQIMLGIGLFVIITFGKLMINFIIFLCTSSLLWGRYKRSVRSSGTYLALDTTLTWIVHLLCDWK